MQATTFKAGDRVRVSSAYLAAWDGDAGTVLRVRESDGVCWVKLDRMTYTGHRGIPFQAADLVSSDPAPSAPAPSADGAKPIRGRLDWRQSQWAPPLVEFRILDKSGMGWRDVESLDRMPMGATLDAARLAVSEVNARRGALGLPPIEVTN